MMVPTPTPIYRIMHVDNLCVCLRRGGLHASNHTPDDGLPYRTIHNTSIQQHRRTTRIPCGPGGVVHDYVPFYFGFRSPMMLQLKTGRVPGYDEGQEPLIYLESTAQVVQKSNRGFVFSDGHGIAVFTKWFDDLKDLGEVDWSMVYQQYWPDHPDDMDRQRRKQAEFLVHEFCDWSLIESLAVIDDKMKKAVECIMRQFPVDVHRKVRVKRDWYY
jgi:hypothetical protein